MEYSDSIHIYLIRHGMTKYNTEKKYLGHTDIPVIQEKLSDYNQLHETLNRIKFDAVYSSDLLRCRQTASLLFDKEDIIFDQRLREMHFGDWEGKTYEQLKHEPAYCKWLSDWETEYIPNGENWERFKSRIQQFMHEEILPEENRGKTITIVSHGGVIRQIVSGLNDDLAFWDVNVEFGKAIILDVNYSGGDFKCTSLSVVPTAENANS